MKILLVCSEGTSTSLVVSKMEVAVKEQGKDHEIKAVSSGEAKLIGKEYDVILFGPQVKFMVKNMKKLFPAIPIDSIPTVMYGRVDGAGVLKHAEETFEKGI